MPRAFLITNKRYHGGWILANSNEDGENYSSSHFILDQGQSTLPFPRSPSFISDLRSIRETEVNSMDDSSNEESSLSPVSIDKTINQCQRVSVLTHSALSRHIGQINMNETEHMIETLHSSSLKNFSVVQPINLILDDSRFHDSSSNETQVNAFYLGAKEVYPRNQSTPSSLSSSSPSLTIQEEAQDLSVHGRRISRAHGVLLQNSDYSVENSIREDDLKLQSPIIINNDSHFKIKSNQQVSFAESREVYPTSGDISSSSSSSSSSTPNDNHVCIDCGKRYSTSSNLARHRQTHRSFTDKKARQCPHCNKVYVSMPAYSMHLRTHKQGCRCTYCGKCFSRPWLLQGHIRTHTGEKPFTCPKCSKAFADKSNLRAHIQTHSTVKPYVCQRCGKAFTLKSYLYKHEDSSCMRLNRSSTNGTVAYVAPPPSAATTSIPPLSYPNITLNVA